MRKIKIQESEYEKIVDLYKKGMSQLEIASIYGVCRDTIGKILNKNNVARPVKINICDYDNIIKMYKDGITQRELAEKYNVTQSMISIIIKEHDLDWKNGKLPIVSEHDYGDIIAMYINGMSQPEIAKIYNCSASLISSILKKTNTPTRIGGSKNAMADIAQWAKMYEDGMLLYEIAEKFGTTGPTVSKLLKKNGYDIDRYTYHFNEHYFDCIDSQDKAYILGLLWADGHNSIDKGSVILELQEEDKPLLERINDLTENERPLRKVPLHDKNPAWKNQYRLLWQSKYLSNVLNNYGMYQQKSLVLEFPRWLNEELYPHFIRGYMDGDGCVYCAKQNHRIQVNMIGTRMFLEQVQKICTSIGVKSYITHDKRANEVICQLLIASNVCSITFLDWVYKDVNLKMERKYNKYQQFLQNINNS